MAAAPVATEQQREAAAVKFEDAGKEILVTLSVPAETKARHVRCLINDQKLTLHVDTMPSARKRIADDTLFQPVIADDCTWTLEGEGSSRTLRVTLMKQRARMLLDRGTSEAIVTDCSMTTLPNITGTATALLYFRTRLSVYAMRVSDTSLCEITGFANTFRPTAQTARFHDRNERRVLCRVISHEENHRNRHSASLERLHMH
eukprot:4843906-Pleurochrysis_carterae.AAC.1